MQSSLFRELTDDEMRNVVSALLNTDVVSYRLLTGGMFNTTYYAETASMGKVVIRLGPVNRHLLLPYEHYLMEAENIFINLCHDAGAKVSQVLALDCSKRIIDRDIMIVRYIPSKAMSQTELTDGEREEIRREAGNQMRIINGITGKKFGRPHDILTGGGYDRWYDAVMKEVDEFELVCRPTGLFSEEQHRTIRGLFEMAEELFDEIKVPHLVHNDIWSGNILVTPDTHRFAAVIDGDRAIWGDRDAELACMGGFAGNSDAFWTAYGSRPEETKGAKIRIALYDLLMAVWAVYIYDREYNNFSARDSEYKCSMELINKIKALYEA